MHWTISPSGPDDAGDRARLDTPAPAGSERKRDNVIGENDVGCQLGRRLHGRQGKDDASPRR
jgi:hypothetical protein